MSHNDIWLVGAGPMAQAYAAVLQAMKCEFTVVGRSKASAEAFEKAVGMPVVSGGLDKALESGHAPKHAFIATNIESLAETILALLRAGTENILVEKPATLYAHELAEIVAEAEQRKANVFVAYNRRFFASVIEARKVIEADGGLQSIIFEFNEIAEKVDRPNRSAEIKSHWLLANSTHVIDLAFCLAGVPTEWSAFRNGALSWHKNAAIFTGAGMTVGKVLFSYAANWNGPGRWGMELVTAKHRMMLRPMEKLAIIDTPLGNPALAQLDYSLDERFKPGLYRQVEAFLSGESPHLCTIQAQQEMFSVYEEIGGYSAFKDS